MNKYFQALFTLLGSIFGQGGKPTDVTAVLATDVTAVLATFNTVADQLNQVAEHHNDQVQKHDDAIAEALAKKAESQAQIEQAVTALANIRALLGKK